ncbi:MAG: glycosyltransferase family 4 protein [Clostridia bacterium]|nr:glycosyltransferase family 4 protein [Clostridia bacterium]
MKILLVNKFLYPKGGSETYVFRLGETLQKMGHEVEYFGMEHKDNVIGNRIGVYSPNVDFSKGATKNLSAPFKVIYSSVAKKRMKKVLDNFQPDVIHFNNIQFHLTPSIILAAQSYRRKSKKKVKLVYTAHDYQLVCPSHGLFDSQMNVCEKCLGGNYWYCVKSVCVKKSKLKSLLATADAYRWKYGRAYSYIDTIVCPSRFLKSKLDSQKRFSDKTVVLHNFIETKCVVAEKKENYVLEFGHLSKEKGTVTLLRAAKNMPDIRFVFAGFGEAVEAIADVPNAEYVGFKTGEELSELISKASCSVCPSECYENCPYSVIESQIYGTPVIGSDMGGIPELIREGETGLLFEAGNVSDLEDKLKSLLYFPEKLSAFTENCRNTFFETPETYYEKLVRIYED